MTMRDEIQAGLQSHIKRLQEFFDGRPGEALADEICAFLLDDEPLTFVVDFINGNLPTALQHDDMQETTRFFLPGKKPGYYLAVSVIPRLYPEEVYNFLPQGEYPGLLDHLIDAMEKDVAAYEQAYPEQAATGIVRRTHFVHWIYCSDGEQSMVHLSLLTEARRAGQHSLSVIAEDLLSPEEQQSVLGRSTPWSARLHVPYKLTSASRQEIAPVVHQPEIVSRLAPVEFISGFDDDDRYLQAVPISRKRMDLLWLDPPRLAQLAQPLAVHGKVSVVLGDSSEQREHEYTQEDWDWAKRIEKIIDVAYQHAQNDEYAQSIDGYKQALELAPGCDLFLMSVGYAYAKLGQVERGIRFLERAVQISPGNSRIRNNLNEVRRRQSVPEPVASAISSPRATSIRAPEALKPWAVVGVFILAFVLGQLAMFLFCLYVPIDEGEYYWSYILYGGVVGLVSGGVLMGWRRCLDWAGAFAAVFLGIPYLTAAAYDTFSIPSFSMTSYIFAKLFQGIVFGFVLFMLRVNNPQYEESVSIKRIVIGGGMAFLIAGLVSHMIGVTGADYLIFWGDNIGKVVIALLLMNIIQGLGIGVSMELPRIRWRSLIGLK